MTEIVNELAGIGARKRDEDKVVTSFSEYYNTLYEEKKLNGSSNKEKQAEQ